MSTSENKEKKTSCDSDLRRKTLKYTLEVYKNRVKQTLANVWKVLQINHNRSLVTSTEINETTDLGILFSCRCLACNSRVRDVLLSRQSFRYRTPCAWLCDTTSIQSFPTPPTQTIKPLMICVFPQTSKQQRNRQLEDFDMASHMKISVLHLLVAVLLLCEVIGQRSYSRRTYRRPGARTRYSSGTIRRKGIAPQSIHKFY